MTFPSALKKSSVQNYFLTFLEDVCNPIYDSQRYPQTTYLTGGLECFFINTGLLIYIILWNR